MKKRSTRFLRLFTFFLNDINANLRLPTPLKNQSSYLQSPQDFLRICPFQETDLLSPASL